jgi:hypothetical protein
MRLHHRKLRARAVGNQYRVGVPSRIASADSKSSSTASGTCWISSACAAAAEEGLTAPERSVLKGISIAGPSVAAELTRAEQIRPQGVGLILAGLQGRGLIERHADPATDDDVSCRSPPTAARPLRLRQPSRPSCSLEHSRRISTAPILPDSPTPCHLLDRLTDHT